MSREFPTNEEVIEATKEFERVLNARGDINVEMSGVITSTSMAGEERRIYQFRITTASHLYP